MLVFCGILNWELLLLIENAKYGHVADKWNSVDMRRGEQPLVDARSHSKALVDEASISRRANRVH